jgi:hypothetical protein
MTAKTSTKRSRECRARKRERLRMLQVPVDEAQLGDALAAARIIDPNKADDPKEIAAGAAQVLMAWANGLQRVAS